MTEQPPSAWQIERVMSIAQRAADRLRGARADDAPDSEAADEAADSEAFFEGLHGAGADVRLIVRRLLLAAEEADANAETCKKREADLRARRERFERHKSTWRTAAMQIMQLLPEAFPDGRFRDALVSATVRTGKPGVVVTDIDALDDRFVQIERKPRLTEIAQALKDGEVVTGASLRNGAPFITVKSS